MAEAEIDIRITPLQTIDEITAKVNECTNVSGIEWSFIQKSDSNHSDWNVSLSSPQLNRIKDCLSGLGIECDVKVFPGGTDSRFYRKLGIPCFGISPFRNTPILIHDHDECLSATEFLSGINVYVALLQSLDEA